LLRKGGKGMKLEITKEELVIEDSIKKKVDIICEFCHTEAKYINGSIRKVERSNLVYVEPHRIIINNLTFLVFNNNTNIYLGNLTNQYELKDLERLLKLNV
jgi:hypothetical protein